MIIKKKMFWIMEALLLIAAGLFAFAMIGYGVIALVLCGAAAVAALYRLISCYAVKNPKSAKKLKPALTVLLLAGFALFCAAEIPVISSAHTDKDPEADYLIVLGAGVNGTVPSLTLANRLAAAKDYLDQYPEAKVVVSGGQGPGEDITEAECMRSWLEARGIAPERIIMEDKSTSTYENLVYSFSRIRDDGGTPEGKIAIASNDYHLYRAKYMARELGAEPVGIAARTPYPVLSANYFIREAAAVLLMWIM